MVTAARRHVFSLGRLLATPGALEAFKRAGQQPSVFLHRHQSGDWGDLGTEDKQANDASVRHEGKPDQQQRILSAYKLSDSTKVWIITEWDRSITTILLPEEY